MKYIKLFIICLLLFGIVGGADPSVRPDQIKWNLNVGSQIHGVTNGSAMQDVVTHSQLVASDYYINPLTFGAVGDDSTDDSTALQATIDYAESHGAAIQLPFKRFKYGTSLHIPSGCTIRGVRGRWSWQDGFNGSTLRYTGSGRALDIYDVSGLAYKVTLEDFALIGAGTSIMNGVGTGIYAGNLSEFWFRDLTVMGFATGIGGVAQSIGEISGNDIIFNNVGLHLVRSGRISISDNDIWDNGVGIRISGAKSTIIENNQFERCTDFMKLDCWGGSGYVATTQTVISGNNFQSVPSEYSGSDGLAPYWNCHMLNITNADDPGIILIANDIAVLNNYVNIDDTDAHIDVNFATGDSYAYMTLVRNMFITANLSCVEETGSGTAVVTWIDNTVIPNTVARYSGNVKLSGFENVWDDTAVIGKFTLNSTASTNPGGLWVDSGTNKLMFYSGGVARVVTST